jgi:hypothetical protein
MSLKNIEYLQHESIDLPTIDGNYILFNKTFKFLLNFILTYFFLILIVTNWPDLTIHQFILLVCTITSVLIYILDLNYPSCYI